MVKFMTKHASHSTLNIGLQIHNHQKFNAVSSGLSTLTPQHITSKHKLE
jgi:hypothetical protein